MNSDIQFHLERIQAFDPVYLAIIGGILLLLLVIIIVSIVRSGKKSRAKAVAPNIKVQQLQVAPLGKGVQIKFYNSGYVATIIDLEILKRHDIEITQGYKDYALEGGKFYTVFCETVGGGRADNGFDMILYYTDELNNSYKQSFHIENNRNASDPSKLVRYA